MANELVARPLREQEPQFRTCPRTGLQFHRSAERLIKLNAVGGSLQRVSDRGN